MRSYFQILGFCALALGLSVALNAERECSCDYTKTWLDMVFVFDSTKEINMQDFHAIKNFVAMFVGQIPISQEKGAFSRIGLINVGDEAEVVADLTTFKSSKEAHEAVRKLTYKRGNKFNIRRAFVAATNMIDAANDRKNVKKVVVLFSGKNEDCAYQLSPMQKIYEKMVKNAKEDDNPCRLAAYLRANGHTVMTVAMKYDGVEKYPEIKLASDCFAFNFDTQFNQNFLKAVCSANCYCNQPYVQFTNNCKRFGECVYQHGTPSDYPTAEITCMDYKATMTTVFSLEKELFVRKIAGSDLTRPYWIGMKNVNGNYVWSNGAAVQPGDYNNWGNQNPKAGDCVFDDGVWNTDSCEIFAKFHYYSCQKNACDTNNYCEL